MTEKEAIGYIKRWFQPTTEPQERKKAIEALAVVYRALEEIQQYRAIGTVEECREAAEKLPTAKEAIRKLLCSEYGSSCQFCIYDNVEDAMCCNVGGSGSWCCENAKWNGGLE